MDVLFPNFSSLMLLSALAITVCAGFVKGVVGFALPLFLISGLTTFISPELALAGLILPTLVANAFQSLRQGWGAAWRSIKSFKTFLLVGGVTLVLAAQMVQFVPENLMLLVLGVLIVLLVSVQMFGVPIILPRKTPLSEGIFGGVAGVLGGMSGSWGSPTVIYLTALNTDKADQMRIQGVIYGLGAIALTGAHLASGILNTETLPFSALLILPAMLGMWMGGKVSDRINQTAFRRVTLLVLLIAGLNLIRRAAF